MLNVIVVEDTRIRTMILRYLPRGLIISELYMESTVEGRPYLCPPGERFTM